MEKGTLDFGKTEATMTLFYIIYHVSSIKYPGFTTKPWLCHCKLHDLGQVTEADKCQAV